METAQERIHRTSGFLIKTSSSVDNERSMEVELVALDCSGKALCMFVKRMTGHARNIKLLVDGILVAVSRDLQHRQAKCVLCHKLA